MAKRTEIVIRTESFVRVDGAMTGTKDLTPAQRAKLAGWLKLNWCQALYQGKAVFSLSEEGADFDLSSGLGKRSLEKP